MYDTVRHQTGRDQLNSGNLIQHVEKMDRIDLGSLLCHPLCD